MTETGGKYVQIMRIQSQLWPALFWCCNNELEQEALGSESLKEPRAGREENNNKKQLKKNKKQTITDYWQNNASFKLYA